MLIKFLTGGFLAGYRTYILGFLLLAQAVAQWAIGDMSMSALVAKLPELIGGLGLMSLRASVGQVRDAL